MLKIGPAAKLLGVSKDTLRRWEAAGKIKSKRTKKGYRVYEEEHLKALLRPEPQGVKIGEAARQLNVSIDTLRRWAKNGKLKPQRAKSGYRIYDPGQLIDLNQARRTNLIDTQQHQTILEPYKEIQNQIIQPQIQLSDSIEKALDKELPAPQDFSSQITPTDYSQVVYAKNFFFSKKIIFFLLILLILPGLFLNQNTSQLPAGMNGSQKNSPERILRSLLRSSSLSLKYLKNDQKISSALRKIPLLASVIPSEPSERRNLDLNNQSLQDKSLKIATSPMAPRNDISKGQVLAESSPSGSFLEINLDTTINGLLSASEASVSGALSVSNVKYNFPDTQGEALTFLQDDGAGNLSWTNVPQPGIATTTTAGIASFSNSFFTVSNAGAVTLIDGGITTTQIKDGTISNSDLASSSITVSPGSGMSGGGSVSLGGSITLTNAGVTSITGTSNQVIASASTGGVTLTLPQSIATTSSPEFAGLTLSGLATGAVYNSSGVLASETQLATSRGGTGQDFSSTAQGSVPYFSATGTFSTLAPSTSGYVLTTQGAGANPIWSDPGTIASRWDTIADPTANQSMGMSTYTTTFNWATGTSTNDLFSFTTDASANGTGSLVNIQTGTSASVIPLRIRAGSTEGLFVSSGANVGIGTTANSSKLYLNATQTSGNIFKLAYDSAVTIAGDTTGLLVDLNSGTVVATNQNLTGVNFKIPTVTDTHTSGTKTLTGMLVNFGSGAGINQTGAGGTLEYAAGDFQLPALTQSAGTLNAYGLKVTTPSSITTGGTAYGARFVTTGVGAGTLYGVSVDNITGGAGTEYAFNVAGTSWDAVLRVGSTTVINGLGVTQVVGGGTGLATFTQNGVLYGNATSNLGVTAEGATGQVLIGNTGGAPTWGTISGSTCTNCLVNNPSSTQTIAPTGAATQGLSVRQTSTALGGNTQDIFNVTSSDGATKYFYVDYQGNVSSGSISNTNLTITPTTDSTALTLVGTNVTSAKNQYINTKNSSGTIFDLSYGAAQTLAGTVIAQNIDLSNNVTATNQSETGLAITLAAATNTSGTQNYKGLVVTGGAINENGGTATNFYGADITIPALTQTLGTLTAYGAQITTPSSITTGGTAYGLYVNAGGVGAGTLYGANISAITAGAGTEVGLQIGSGWDTNLLFNDTTTNVAVADGGVITIADSAGNSLCTVTDNGTTGTLNCTGNITAGGGTVGAWSDDGTTLTPANANRVVSVSSNSTANPVLALTASGASSNAFLLTASGTTTGNAASIVASALTTGKALSVATSGNTWTGNSTTSGLVDIASTSTAGTASESDILLKIARSGANAQLAHTAYGVYSTVTNTNATSGTNIAGYFSASGATTANYGLLVAAGNVGIGDASPDALFDIDSSATSTSVFGLTQTGSFTGTGSSSVGYISSAATTGDVLSISATALTSGSQIVLTGPSGSTAGVTDAAININSDIGDIGSAGKGLIYSQATIDTTAASTSGVNLYLSTTNSNSTNTNAAYGSYNTISDSTALANVIYGNYNTITLSGNAAKSALGIYSNVTSSSTTADTLYMIQAGGNTTGAIGAGTRTIYSILSQPQSSGASTAGTLNMYAGYFEPIVSGPTTGSTATTNAYGVYITPNVTHAADVGTVNTYGLYVANGTTNANGTSTKYGIYVASPTGADANYAAVFAGGNIGIGTNPTSFRMHFLQASDTSSSGIGMVNAAAANSGRIWMNGADLVLQGGANDNQLVLDSGGNVGISTTSPASILDIDTASNSLGLRLRGLAETTEIADIYVGANGELILSTVAGADTAQYIDLKPEDNEYGLILRDGLGTGSAYANFYVNDTAGTDYLNIVTSNTNGATGLVLANGGNVGIGITAVVGDLHLKQKSQSQGVGGMTFERSDNSNRSYAFMGGDNQFYIYVNGTTNACSTPGTAAWSCSSDRRQKENIQAVSDNSLGLISQLKPSTFNFISDPDKPTAGFIAQEVLEVFPNAVTMGPHGYYLLNSNYMIPYTVKAIQELSSKVDNINIYNGQFTIDSSGYLVMGNVKMNKISVSGDVNISGNITASQFSLDASSLNRTGSLASVPVDSSGKVSVADSLNSLNSAVSQNSQILRQAQDDIATQSGTLAVISSTLPVISSEVERSVVLGEQAAAQAQSLDEKVASTSANLASLSEQIQELLDSTSFVIPSEPSERRNLDLNKIATDSASPRNDTLNLTPPDLLTASGSATLANLTVTDSLSTLNLEALDATVSGTFKALGENFLGKTTVAGDLTVDGTFSITGGNSINAFPILYLQNNPLAEILDIFNGKAVITKDGQIAGTALALGSESLGETILTAGQTEVTIPTPMIKADSKVFITPTSEVTGSLYISQITEGTSFKVKLSTPNTEDVKFNWLIVQSKKASN